MANKNESLPVWDLEAIYPSLEDWQRDFDMIRPMTEKFASFKGRLGESAEVLKAAVEAGLELNRITEKVYVYSHLTLDQDTGVDPSRARHGKLNALLAELSPLEAYFTPELMEIADDRMAQFLDSAVLAPYRRHLQEILAEKKHILSEPEEKLLGSYSNVLGLSSNVFNTLNDTDLDFGSVKDEKGKAVKLSHGSYLSLMENPDREVRKRTFKKLYRTYNQFKNTFASTLDGTVRRHTVGAKIRNFPNALNAALEGDRVPESVYRNLIAAVHEKLPAFYDYMELRREVMKLEKLDMFDIYNPLLPDCRKEYSFAEAAELVKAAVKPLGPEYGKALELAFKQRWIDTPERKGKRSGAYSSGCFDTYPYVLMTFKGTLNDVFTLAHELGHSMHSYFSNCTQPYVYADYRIFVAEVASTTNEILLFEHLLEQSSDPAFRAYLYGHLADEIRGTIYRQTMFAEFELFMHESVEQGTPLTAELLNKKYYELNKEFYGPAMEPDKAIALEWARIPHFHYNFYVYKYATGMSAALKLAANLRSGRKELREAYLGFLKAGSSKDVLDIMKDAGVDLSTREPVISALDYFGNVVTSLRRELQKAAAQGQQS
ncbi:MAG: oligoendopeptidase F [Lentisphaeria bacterium]|nr:oligoendopeptidase F [Lentisphaeria bacterium]